MIALNMSVAVLPGEEMSGAKLEDTLEECLIAQGGAECGEIVTDGMKVGLC